MIRGLRSGIIIRREQVMDPDAALRDIRAQISAFFADASDYDEAELVHRVHDLDEWLSKGGFLPAAWRRTP